MLPRGRRLGSAVQAKARSGHGRETLLVQKSVASVEDVHGQGFYKGSGVGKWQKEE